MELPITERQFAALAWAAGISKTSASHAAMKMIFTQGMAPSEVARTTGLQPSTVCNARAKMFSALALIPGKIARLQEAMGQ